MTIEVIGKRSTWEVDVDESTMIPIIVDMPIPKYDGTHFRLGRNHWCHDACHGFEYWVVLVVIKHW